MLSALIGLTRKKLLLQPACLPAGAGGLSARVVDWESEAADWAELTRIEGEPDVLKPMDMNIRTTVDEDLKLLKRSLVLAAKRKGSPSWSVPTELLLLALKPGYTSVSRDTKAGVGATPLDEETAANTSGACLLHLREFLWHLHRCTLVPLVAVRSRAFMIPKKTACKGYLANEFCTYIVPSGGTGLALASSTASGTKKQNGTLPCMDTCLGAGARGQSQSNTLFKTPSPSLVFPALPTCAT